MGSEWKGTHSAGSVQYRTEPGMSIDVISVVICTAKIRSSGTEKLEGEKVVGHDNGGARCSNVRTTRSIVHRDLTLLGMIHGTD